MLKIFCCTLCLMLVSVSHVISSQPLPESSQNQHALNVNVIDVNHDAVANIVVYLEPYSLSQKLPFTQRILKVSQQDKSFIPYLSVMQKGNSVNFVNQDDITHHIYSPVGENKFSFKIKAEQEKLLKKIEHSGEIAMGCNIHDWMSGYILVVDSPYFAKTNAQGIAEIPNVISGEYFLHVWHPQLKSKNNQQTQRINVTDNTEIVVNLSSRLDAIPEQQGDDDFDFLSDY